MPKTEPIRIGLVGVGRAGWGMHTGELEGRQRTFQFVAACDTIKARRDKMAERYGCKTYRKIDDLVKDGNVELVVIATRSSDHFAHVAAALKSGKHVFVEKPMCCDYAEARRLVAAAGKAKGTLYVRHNRRFEAPFQHIREIIDSRILGNVHSIKLRRGGFQRRDDWQTLKRFGGGQLLNWGPHIVDHALQFLGAPPVRQWSSLAKVAAMGDAEDHVRILLENEQGMVVDLEISGGRVITEPAYIVQGTRGSLSSSGNTIQLRYLDPRCKLPSRRARSSTPAEGSGFGSKEKLKWVEKEIEVRPKLRVSTDVIWDYLFDAIRKDAPFPVTLEQSAAVMKVISEARKGTAFA